MINLVINDRNVQAAEGQTILQAARAAGIHIPTLCYLEGVNDIGACRVCVVEVEGIDEMIPSCNTKVREGMIVHTDSERVLAARKTAVDLLLANHRINCFSCQKNGVCELQALAKEFGLERSSFVGRGVTKPVLNSHPFLLYDANLCIHCQRCVNTCARRTGRHAIGVGEAGALPLIKAPFGAGWDTSLCESCGSCAENCPTGALAKKESKNYNAWEVDRVRTTCPHCAVGCQYDLLVKDNKIVGVEGADGPTNHKLLCVKGRFGSYKFVHAGDRLTDPLIKDRATGEFRTATWDEALDLVAEKFLAIKKEYGGEALAGFACSRSTNEDIYMLQKMVRSAFGSNNTDNCARV